MEIRITGMEQIKKKLERSEVNRLNRKAGAKGMVILQRELMTYPPQPPQSTYVRTMMLSGSWKWKARSTSARIWSDDLAAPYNLWVQSDRFQASVHKGRWRTEKMVWDSNEARILRIFDEEYTRELNKTYVEFPRMTPA